MVSILTPVFNAARHLSTCVASIEAQTYTDWELLLIDDGSTDGSGALCDAFADKDPRIRVFHTEHQGVAAARQLGIEQARGEYSIHVDADDWIEKQMLAAMVSTLRAENADVVVCDFFMDKNGTSRRIRQQLSPDSDAVAVVGDILCGKMHGSLCNKLIRHALYGQYALRFTPGVNLCEDALLCIRLFQCPIIYRHADHAYYHYVDHGEASMARKYDARMYASKQKYLEAVATICPPPLRPLLDAQRRSNELTAMLHHIFSAETAYRKGVRLHLSDLTLRNIGMRGRLFVLAYALGAPSISDRLNRQHGTRR